MGMAFDGPDGIRKAVRININNAGADQIKIFVRGTQGEFKAYKFGTDTQVERLGMRCLFTKGEIQAAVDTAHCVGKKVAAHCLGG